VTPPHSPKAKPSEPQNEGDRSASSGDREPPSPQPATARSDDSTSPIITAKRGRKTSSIKSALDVPKLKQVIDQLRRARTGSSAERIVVKDDNFEYDESEIDFLDWLDSEIKKIDDFYQEKEREAVKRYHVLSQQLEALRQLRDSQGIPSSTKNSEAPSRRDTSVSGAVGSTLDGVSSSSWGKPIKRIRASFDAVYSAMPAADHERRAKDHPELMAHPISTTTGYVDYRVARRRLKEAVLEYYRSMELLKQYRLLNRTGLAKILKKFDKTSGRRIAHEYDQKLKQVYFDQSDILETTMSQTEV